jgi:NTE family protein
LACQQDWHGGDDVKGIGLVLGGGGARGFAHIGVLRALAEAAVPVEEIAGTSMGAIIGAYYAKHGDVAGLEAFARGLGRKTLLSYFDPRMPRHSLLGGRKLRAQLERWFGDATIESLKIPLAITATELTTGESAVFRSGPLVSALLASSAIPGVFPAVQIDGRWWVDGGVQSQLPHDALLRTDIVKVFVGLPIIGERALTAQPTILETLAYSYAIGRRLQTAAEMRAKTKEGVLILPETGDVSALFAFRRAGEFVRNGEMATRAALPEITKRLGR